MNVPEAFFWSGVVIAAFPVLVFAALAGIAVYLSIRVLKSGTSGERGS